MLMTDLLEKQVHTRVGKVGCKGLERVRRVQTYKCTLGLFTSTLYYSNVYILDINDRNYGAKLKGGCTLLGTNQK